MTYRTITSQLITTESRPSLLLRLRVFIQDDEHTHCQDALFPIISPVELARAY